MGHLPALERRITHRWQGQPCTAVVPAGLRSTMPARTDRRIQVMPDSALLSGRMATDCGAPATPLSAIA
jgi:hypothetical protein